MSHLPHFFEFHRSELGGEGVVELFHGDLSVLVVIEASHEHVLLVVRHVDVQSKETYIHR